NKEESYPNNENQVAQKQNVNKKNQTILSFHPRIVAIPETENVYMTWYQGFNVLFKNHYVLLTDIFFTRSTNNGATFEKPISLTNYSVWAKDSDNGATFEKPISLSGYSGWTINSEIGMSHDKFIYIAWQSNPQGRNGQIVFTRSTNNGTSFENPITISDKNVDSLNPQIALSKENVYLTWQSNPQGRNGQIVFTRSTNNGTSFENPITIGDKNVGSVNPQIAISKGNNVYWLWNSNGTGNEEIMLLKTMPKNIQLISSNSLHKDSILQNNSSIYMSNNNPKNIALIERTFTDAAYDNAFYLFYGIKHNQSSNITKYTNLFSSNIVKQYSILPEFEAIVNHLKWLTPQSNITILTDADAHNASSLFTDNGTIKYDVILLGHSEYVTQQEYNNLRQFVGNGGILILLDGNVFYGEVNYDEKNQTITLVKGHGWDFSRGSASHDVKERWADETREWVGSNYCNCFDDDIRFGNNPFGVRHNEEQNVTNPKVKILLDYNATDNDPKPKHLRIATYELSYKKGKVITLGLYTDDLLFYNDKFKRFFDSLFFYYVVGKQNWQIGNSSII